MMLRHRLSKRRSVWHRAFAGLIIQWFCATIMAAGVCHASTVEVNLREGAVQIIAHQAPLIDVLKALAQKAGFVFYSGDPMQEAVTLNIEMESAEACVRRLVAHRNFAFYYKRLEDHSAALMEIRVFGPDSPATFSAQPNTTVPPRERERRVARTWYQSKFSNAETLLKQISAKEIRTPGDMNMPGAVGIQLTKIGENSIFSRIGIKAGDIISDINGTSIGSSRDLIGALQAVATDKMTTIRIERANQDGEMDPIYVELN